MSTGIPKVSAAFLADLVALINKHGVEAGSNTPDFLLADYLVACLEAFNATTSERERWYGRPKP